MSVQKLIYSRALGHYRYIIIEECKAQGVKDYEPSDDEIYERLPLCLQLFKATYEADINVEFKVANLEEIKRLTLNNQDLAVAVMHVLKDQDNVPDKVKRMLYRDYPDLFKEYFTDDFKRFLYEDCNVVDPDQYAHSTAPSYYGGSVPEAA